jgi:hypothetical protein
VDKSVEALYERKSSIISSIIVPNVTAFLEKQGKRSNRNQVEIERPSVSVDEGEKVFRALSDVGLLGAGFVGL